jgi:hypothetical protein
LLFILFIIFTMADLRNSEIAALKAKISRWEDQLEGASEEREKDRLVSLISSRSAYLTELLKQQSAPGKPPPSTSLLSSSSFHPLFDFIFLFNSHAILSLLGFSFPVIYL